MTLSLEELGFGLRRIETRDGSLVFALDTPFMFITNASIDVFVEQIGDKFHIFDDGMTLHEVLTSGVDMSSRYKWDSLRKIVGEWDVNFSHSGTFERYSSADKARETTADFLRAMFSIDDWIFEQVVHRKPVDTLVEESKMLFKRWWRTNEIVNHPKVSSDYGEQLEFDFKVKDTYVDVISPHKVSSASTIRKLLATPSGSETLVVIDDRYDAKKAEQETCLVSRVSDTIYFSRLKKNASEFNQVA